MSGSERPSGEGSLRHKALEVMKSVAFRTPLLNFLSRPRYAYNIDPAQLCWLVEAIDKSRANARPGAIVEVGVARGMTTTFLLEHMKRSGDNRTYACIDSFEGFVESDIEYEVNTRNKHKADYGGFRYNDVEVFKGNLAKNGYANVHVHKGDASAFDFASIAPVDVMLLDVDLYVPTRNVLKNVWDRLNDKAFVMVDDCMEGNIYDGGYMAYKEFCGEKRLTQSVVGTKGGVIVKGG